MFQDIEKLYLRGWDYVAGKFKKDGNVTTRFKNFEESNPGNVITVAAANQMVEKLFWDKERAKLANAKTNEESEAILNQTACITFSKRVLMLLMSQAGCEGIRFYIAERPLNPDADQSPSIRTLVLVGVDDQLRDLGTTSPGKSIILDPFQKVNNEQETLIAEVGGHGSLKELLVDKLKMGPL